AAVGRERLIAHFPAFAVRAVVDGFAVQLFGSGNIRQVVDETGRDQELAAAQGPAALRGQLETFACCHRVFDALAAKLDGFVAGDFLAGDPPQLGRSEPVAAQETMHRVRRGIAVLAGVEKHDAPAAAAKHQGRRKSGRASTDDRHFTRLDVRGHQLSLFTVVAGARGRSSRENPSQSRYVQRRYFSASAYFSSRPTRRPNSSKPIIRSPSRAVSPCVARCVYAFSSARAADRMPVTG